jgi:inosose dehydratase
MTEKEQTRRRFLQAAGIGAAASLAGTGSSLARGRSSAARQSGKQRFELGLASYTLRKFNLDDTLAMTKRVGLKYICFKSFHLPLDSTPAQIQDVVEKVKEAGLILYGGGVISMNNEDQVNNAFDYAKAAGMKVIVGVPAPKLLPMVNKKVKEYDIRLPFTITGRGTKLIRHRPVPMKESKIWISGSGFATTSDTQYESVRIR